MQRDRFPFAFAYPRRTINEPIHPVPHVCMCVCVPAATGLPSDEIEAESEGEGEGTCEKTSKNKEALDWPHPRTMQNVFSPPPAGRRV